MPTLLVAGAEDQLRLPGYAHEVGAKIPDSEVIVYDNAAHCPHIERAEEFNAAAIAFLKKVHEKKGIAAEAA